MEKRPEQEPATREAVMEAFREGNRMNAQRMFDEWLNEQDRRGDREQSSQDRLRTAVETIEIYAAAGEKDMLVLEFTSVQNALESDPTISDDKRAELSERLAKAWTEAT